MPRLRSATQETSTSIQVLLDVISPLFEFAEDEVPLLSTSRQLTYERNTLLLTETVYGLLPPMGKAQAEALIDDVIGDLVKPAGIRAADMLAELGRRLTPEGEREVRVIAFLNAPPDQSPDGMAVAETEFAKVSEAEMDGILSNKPLMEKAAQHNPSAAKNLARFSAYVYAVRTPEYLAAQGLEFVADRITEPFERLRSLLNFAHHRRRITMHFGVRREPMARYAVSPFQFLKSGDKIEEDFFWEVMPPDYRFHPIDPETRDAFARGAEHVYGPASGKLAQHTGNLLLIYQKALDTPDPEVAFFHFWQILEGIASPTKEGRGIESNRLVQRLKQLAPLEQTEEATLLKMVERRNELVHRSVFPEEDAERQVRIIKLEADKFLLALLSILPQLPDVIDLIEYYNVASDRSEARLRALERALGLIKKPS